MRKKIFTGKLLLSALLMLSTLCFAKGQNEPRTIANILSASREKFDVDFIYQANTLPPLKLSFDVDKYNSVEALLNDLLPPYELKFKKVLTKAYVVYRSMDELRKLTAAFEAGNLPGLNSLTASQKLPSPALLQVTGTVSDQATAMPLEGVSILLKGTTRGTYTTANGSFTIDVPSAGSILQFSIVGYEAKELPAGESGNMQVGLVSLSQSLNDVVVIGYGTKKRKDLTTAISSVTAKDIAALPVADAAQALQGKVSGVTIVQNSGAPGGTGGTGIRIRGISSITQGNNPLIVVDGYPLPDQNADNVLNSFGTGDIESIDVLKDAAAASIYGVRASNGVIIVTTKRGRAGKTSLNVDMYAGIQNAWTLPKMLNAKEYAILNSEANIASGLPVLPNLADINSIETRFGEGTDWLDEVFRRAAMRSVNISASGGSDKAQYLFSAGYFKQDGILYNTDVERFNLRFNGDVKVNDKIKIGNSLSLNKLTERGADTYSAFNSIILLALTSPPTVRPRNADGTYAGGNGNVDGFNEPNPIYQLEVPNNRFTKYRITGNVYAEITLLKGLKLKTVFGADFNYLENRNFSPATPSSGGRPILFTGYFTQKGLYPDYLAEYTLTYDKTFGKHKFNVLGGYTFQENQYSFVNASRGNGVFNPAIPVLNNQVLTVTDISQIGNAAEDGINQRFISYIGRLNYDFDDRGSFGISVRRDGSSNFAPKNRFAIFPSFSASWRLSNEPFLENSSLVDDLKVRASFGYTGNPNVPGNLYLQAINQGFQYTFGNSAGSGGIVNATAPSRSFNPDIRWEKNEQLNVGVDGSMLNNRLGFSVDVYQRRSKDLILSVAFPFISGTFEPIQYNTGTLQNRGIDLSLNGNILTSRSFRWNANAIVSTYQNKVTSLGLAAPIDNGFARIQGGSLRTSVDLPIGYFYGFVTDGIFQNEADIAKSAVQTAGSNPTTSTAPGDFKFKDLNGDGVINNDDRTNIGNANPTFTYGLTNNITAGNFEITLFLQGSQGNKVLNFTRWYTEGGVSNGNYSNKVIERWTGPGTSNTMPRLILNDPNQNARVSDRFVEDASYLRLKNVRIGYTIPAKWATAMKLKKTQLYATAQNLFTITNYTGLDPEVGGGVDIGFYPQARTFLLGVNVEF